MKRTLILILSLALGCLTLSALKIVGAQTPEEKKNLDVATKMFRDMLQYGHLELAATFMSPEFINHNPNVFGGRDGFVKAMSQGHPPEPIREEWKNPHTMVITAGPYVMFMRDTKAKDPSDPSKEYIRDHFNLVRIENGRIVEFWDEARKNVPASAQARK